MNSIVKIIEPGAEIQELQTRSVGDVSKLLPNSQVEAIGSMSVPLAGKEEIDIMVITDDVERDSKILEINGYRQGPVVKGISYLKRKENGIEIAPQVIPKGHKMIGIHHSIIQKLRNNNELRQQYEDLKRSMNGLTTEEYKLKKGAWIRENLLKEELNNVNYKEYFKGKKITQLGLGLLGRGLGDAIFLAECGADLIVTDLKTEEELKTSVDELKQYPNIVLHLGGHNLEDFRNRDFILKGAGVPLDSVYIEEARKNNIPIEMDSSLFCKLLPKDVVTIGVTGTRGKSTVTHLINHILKGVGKKTILGGNIRDMATLPFIKSVVGDEIVVLELDSWQLQGFGDSKISPHIAIFTAFMHDHTNYYQSTPDMPGHERYFADKANIYIYQKPGDTLVAGEIISNVIASKPHGEGELVIARRSTVPTDWKPKIIGEHNISNIACAIEACRALEINDDDIKKGVESFDGVEGRLQFVKEINGVKIYNDNNATTAKATEVALEALNPKSEIRNIILIMGGSDKGLELNELVEKMNKTCKNVILLPGSGSEKLTASSLQPTAKITPVQNLSEAVTKAIGEAQSGDVILFSPAFASFGLFKNEYERNDEFMKIINELI